MLRKIKNIRNRDFITIDFFIFMFTPIIALILRLDGVINLARYWPSIIYIVLIYMFIKFLFNYLTGIYRRLWKHAGVDELALIIVSLSGAGVTNGLISIALRSLDLITNLPRSLPYLDTIVTLIIFGFSRMFVRLTLRVNQRKQSAQNKVIIVGAGQAGVSLAKDMISSTNLGYFPVAFIDDDPEKIGLRIRGINVVGDLEYTNEAISRFNVDTIVIAIPSASGSELRKIINKCKTSGVEVKTIPSLPEIIDGKVDVTSIREININDLLRRDPVETDCQNVQRFIENKVAVVTGAGGSIGSELCRQIFNYAPQKLILLGRGENSIFKIQQELLSLNKNRDSIVAVIADIKDELRLDKVFSRFKPDIVFHAAAHKHVPLMEDNPYEAIKNNIFGTNNILKYSEKYGVKKLIMISTDKAVNSSSVMGVTKRIAETLVIKNAKQRQLPYSCVRFGNVLGSTGSVVPIFKKQIEKGGPVTVTDPDVKRFFMTIPEAVQLVLQAANIGKGGEIFVLNMGEPIKIVNLAKDMMKLSGYKEDDIEIKFTGLRPGEKLFEELFIEGEKYDNTTHKKIFIARNASEFIPDSINDLFTILTDDLNWETNTNIKEMLKKIINEYIPESLGDLSN